MLTILQGDALDKLRELPSESVHCTISSPPYWGLRDYGTAQWEGGDDGCDHVEKSTRGDAGDQRAVQGHVLKASRQRNQATIRARLRQMRRKTDRLAAWP